MKRIAGILALAAIVLTFAASCSHKARVIPEKKFSRIYADMFIADQWLNVNKTEKKRADTLWFYRPIFEKYGYTMDDYVASVSYYLREPEKYSKILKSTKEYILKQKGIIEKERDAEIAARDALEKIRKFNAGVKLYNELFGPMSVIDTISISMDSTGMYKLDSVGRDTMWAGPKMIVAED
ncbi:MAG: DUF4296 domain-containing protein [Bacteroidales bacterium]|nr:DUF4296 domain-containing protein [Bacteroidales bacterium]